MWEEVESTATLDSLLDEARKLPALTREEELAFFETLRTGSAEDQKLAMDRLFLSNILFVSRLAYGFPRKTTSIWDLVAEGAVGLLDAISTYDPAVGAGLRSYAYPKVWIRIFRFLMLSDGVCRMPMGAYRQYRAERLQRKETGDYGKTPAYHMPYAVVSDLQMPEKGEHVISPLETADLDDSPLDILLRKEDTRLYDALGSLDEKSNYVLSGAFGIGRPKITQRAMARALGVSDERVRVIKVKALKTMRSRMEN